MIERSGQHIHGVAAGDIDAAPGDNGVTSGIANKHSEAARNSTQQCDQWQRLLDSAKEIWNAGTFEAEISGLMMETDGVPAQWHMHMHMHIHMLHVT